MNFIVFLGKAARPQIKPFFSGELVLTHLNANNRTLPAKRSDIFECAILSPGPRKYIWAKAPFSQRLVAWVLWACHYGPPGSNEAFVTVVSFSFPFLAFKRNNFTFSDGCQLTPSLMYRLTLIRFILTF